MFSPEKQKKATPCCLLGMTQERTMEQPDYRKVLDFTPEILEQGRQFVDDTSKAKFLKGANGMLLVGGLLLGLAALIASAMGEVSPKTVLESNSK